MYKSLVSFSVNLPFYKILKTNVYIQIANKTFLVKKEEEELYYLFISPATVVVSDASGGLS
jgi:hypothetical protein